jgi:translocator protein
MNPTREAPQRAPVDSFRPELIVSTVAAPRRAAMRELPAFAIAVGVLLAVAGAGAFFAPGAWYAALAKPWFTPPDALFGPAWAVLYAFNAIALALVLKAPRSPARRAALVAMGVQLALNALWTPVFFGAQSPFGGLLVITALLLAIGVAIVRVRPVSGLGAALLLPYAAWVAFAATLNLSIWMLNGAT